MKTDSGLLLSVEINNLSRTFGKVQALSSLNLTIAPGLLHGVIGSDGAGKTTLFRILAGLLHPGSGSINYFSKSNPVSFEDIRPSVAYMPSSASLYPDLSINEHLEFFRRLYRLGNNEYFQKRAELLSITRLEKSANKKVRELSGGMYKKTALMCTLLSSPSLMLLDEPTNGVDPISRREFWELLYGLAEKKILVIVSTAYMDEAERCSRVHLLDSGRVLMSGEPKNLLAKAGVKSFDEIFMRE